MPQARSARAGRWLLLGALFGLGMAWRDAPALKLLDLAAVLACIVLAVQAARGTALSTTRLVDYTRACLNSAIGYCAEPVILISARLNWKELNSGIRSRHALAVVRGFAIACPLLFLFGTVFAQADPVFSHLATNIFDIDPAQLIIHGAVIFISAWIAAGTLSLVVEGPTVKVATPTEVEGMRMGNTEAIVAMTACVKKFL